jgi:hypothetical protein
MCDSSKDKSSEIHEQMETANWAFVLLQFNGMGMGALTFRTQKITILTKENFKQK